MGKKYSTITEEEFEKIKILDSAGLKTKQIKEFTGRSLSTICLLKKADTLKNYKMLIEKKRQLTEPVEEKVEEKAEKKAEKKPEEKLPTINDNPLIEALQANTLALLNVATIMENRSLQHTSTAPEKPSWFGALNGRN